MCGCEHSGGEGMGVYVAVLGQPDTSLTLAEPSQAPLLFRSPTILGPLSHPVSPETPLPLLKVSKSGWAALCPAVLALQPHGIGNPLCFLKIGCNAYSPSCLQLGCVVPPLSPWLICLELYMCAAVGSFGMRSGAYLYFPQSLSPPRT